MYENFFMMFDVHFQNDEGMLMKYKINMLNGEMWKNNEIEVYLGVLKL